MGDWFKSENNIYTLQQRAWFFRKKTLLEKIVYWLFGIEETVESHFAPDYPYPRGTYKVYSSESEEE